MIFGSLGIYFLPMKRYTLLLGLLGIFILVMPFLLIFKRSILSNHTYHKVEVKPVKRVIYASGYAKPVDYVLIKAEISGYVNRIYVKEGDLVKKGALLAEIDPRGVPAQLAEVEKRLSLVEERLKPDSDYLMSLQREIEIAERDLHNEEVKFRRREQLFKEGLISKEDLEEASRRFENAKDLLTRLRNRYADTVKALQTEKKSLLEQKRYFSTELKRYLVRAPISGTILKKYVEEGDYVNAFFSENKLFSIGGKEFEVILEIDEEYAGLIKTGQTVFLSFDSYPDRVFEGKVFQILKEVDRSKRSFIAKARVDEFIDLPAQSTVEANILLEERTALVVPLKAVKEDGTVELKGKGSVRVKLGERYGDYVEVLSGVKEGEEVRIFK